MSDLLADWQARREAAKPKPPREGDGPRWNEQERRALRKLRREAKAAGATLATGGKGGLRPSKVLGVMRRDGYRCASCGAALNLGIHHKASDHMADPALRDRADKLKRAGREDDASNLTTICESREGYEGCHDEIHQRDRAEHGQEDDE